MSMRETPSGAGMLTLASAADTQGERERPLDWRLSRRIVGAMLRYRALFVVILLLACALAVVNGALPHVAGLVMGGPVAEPRAFEARWGIDAMTGVWIGVGAMAALAILWMVVMRWRFVAVALMAERVAHDLRAALFRHLMRQSMDFFDRTKVGWLIARGGGDVDQVRGAVSQVIPRLLISAVQMLYCFIAILLYDWVMALILVAIAPVVYVINQRFRRMLSTAHRDTRLTFSRLTANLAESVSGMRVTQAFVREDVNARMFQDLCMAHRANHMKEARAQGLFVPTLDFAGQAFIVIALIAGGIRVEQGLMTVGALIGVMLMTRPFFQPITVIGEMYNLTLQAMAGAERVFRLLDTAPSIVEPASPRPLPRAGEGALVEFDGVTFTYASSAGRPVLDDVSFSARPGETVAIVGHTGAGKTTLIALIAKFYEATQGAIRIDGVPMSAIHSDDLHARLAMVTQMNFLFSASVLDNIRFARPEATEEDVRDVCRRLDCLDLLDALPRGLHTPVGERGESLSLGQRQLVCFARAMIARPRILLLDEATSAVDAVTEHRVQRALERLLEGRTSFVVAHRLSTIRRASIVLVMDRGRIIERGTHAELLARRGAYAALYDEFTRLNEGG
jgi:ATP-binding cassette subfamily B protein